MRSRQPSAQRPSRAAVRSKVTSAATLALAAVAGIAGPTASAAENDLMFDLRVHDTGGKDAVVTFPGQVVTLDLYATVTGANSNVNDDWLINMWARFRSSNGGLLGALRTVSTAVPYGGGTQTGLQTDADGDGDLDIGLNANVTNNSSFFFTSRSQNTTPQPAGGSLIGQFSFTVGTVDDPTATSTDVNMGLITTAGTLTPSYLVRRDGVAESLYTNGGRIGIGMPVTISVGEIVEPGETTFLSGVYDRHLSVQGTVKPTPGTSLTLTRGIDVASGAVFNGVGGESTSDLRVENSISGNSGGTLLTSTMSVGANGAALFNQASGNTAVSSTLAVGSTSSGAAPSSAVQIGGGTFTVGGATTVGATSRIVHTGGTSDFASLSLPNIAGTPGTLPSLDVNGGKATVRAAMNLNGAHVKVSGTGELALARGAFLGNAGLLEVSGGSVTGAGLGVDPGGAIQQTGGSVTSARIDLHGAAGAATPAVGYSITDGTLSTSTIQAGLTQVLQTGGNVNTGTLRLSGQSRYDMRGGQFNANIGSVLGWGNVSADRFLQSGGGVTMGELWVGLQAVYEMTAGTARFDKNATFLGTMDLKSAPVTVTFGDYCFAAFKNTGSLANATNATLVGGVGSLMSFPAGFDPLAQVGHIDTQGLIHVAGQPLIIPSNKSVGGSGTVDGNVSNSGVLAPGNSPGIFEVAGNFSQAGTGSLVVELGGKSSDLFDQLIVTGSADLAGSLSVALIDDFVPAAGDSFTILTAGTLSGQFANAANHIDLVGGGRFDVTYLSTGVTLTNFSAVPEPASLGVLGTAAAALFARPRTRCVRGRF